MSYCIHHYRLRRIYGTNITWKHLWRQRSPVERLHYSKESIAALARRYDITPATVTKWKTRKFVHDAKMGPKPPPSTVLTPEEEAMVVAFRKHTLLPLDDCLYALQDTIPRQSQLLRRKGP
jgi:hypothetical protein